MARACDYRDMATAPAFTYITRNIYMGSKRVLKETGIGTGRPMFSIYVSTASDVRPPRSDGTFETVWVKMDDTTWSFKKDIKTVERLVHVAGTLATLSRQGYKIVIFCHMGMNRSGFMTALVLMQLGWPLGKALSQIRKRHHCVLSNKSFLKALMFIEDNYF